jgi:hypothetical protein
VLFNSVRRGGVFSAVGLDYSYDKFISFGKNKSFDAIRQNLKFNLTEDWGQNVLSSSIHFLNNAAKLNDQASETIGVNFSYTRISTENVRGGFTYSLDLRQFKNFEFQAPKKRKNFLHSLELNASYQIQRDLTLGLSYTEVRNYSNLPSLDTVTIEQSLSGQSSSLGDYQQRLINFNLYWVF